MKIKINKTYIAENLPTYFIADIGANHDGSLKRAKKLIKLCSKVGANAAKFQHFKAETIVSNLGFKSLKIKTHHRRESFYRLSDRELIPPLFEPRDVDPIYRLIYR